MELDRNTDALLRNFFEVIWKRIEPYTRDRVLTRNPKKLQEYRVGHIKNLYVFMFSQQITTRV